MFSKISYKCFFSWYIQYENSTETLQKRKSSGRILWMYFQIYLIYCSQYNFFSIFIYLGRYLFCFFFSFFSNFQPDESIADVFKKLSSDKWIFQDGSQCTTLTFSTFFFTCDNNWKLTFVQPIVTIQIRNFSKK